MSKALPGPCRIEGVPECVGCGYNLTGLARPGRCPECGATFDVENLELHGVPAAASGSAGRRTLWIVLTILVVLLMQFWPLAFMGRSWLAYLILAVVALVGVTAMIATASRERRGVERLVFSSAGIARLPLRVGQQRSEWERTLIPWETACEVQLARVSAVWYRLRVGFTDGRRFERLMFDAGVRCPDAHADAVRTTLRELISRHNEASYAPRPTDSIPQEPRP